MPGRGTGNNPPGRFESLHFEPDPDLPPSNDPGEQVTEFYIDDSQSVITLNQSPDVPFEAGLNPYRGCEHGCVYCYARPTHEYLGLSAGLDFETKVFVKHRAPERLRAELSSKRWKPRVIGLSGVTDPYQPVEGHLKLTRRCLEVLAEFRNPVGIITKNALVQRDSDLLARLAEYDCVSVHISITTLSGALQARMEPRTATPQRRLDAMRRLADAGIPVGLLLAPVIPGLNDHEIPAIVSAAAGAGAQFAEYIPLRLPHGVAALFEDWLEATYPTRKSAVLDRIRSLRGGNLNDPRFGSRMEGEGPHAEVIGRMFEVACRRAGLGQTPPSLTTRHFVRPGPGGQLSLEF